ncbi:hypothetical protein B7R54_05990 [Subtercola boreus]|uniref:Uncharacterized protein n=1 Tax=Subtercola boreus TaxID=120213 RepID=A0A3E0VGQ8_9MICO|nr:hypothetical protein [Subtercola boreus]RFA08825.1 hypothetical protein B7R54_05990 [Subtercola boreus]TQL54206.1 hypothetical protein FB464_1736 [Subtercola boreus]
MSASEALGNRTARTTIAPALAPALTIQLSEAVMPDRSTIPERPSSSTPEFESRFPRRLLFAGAAAGLAGTAVVASASPAEAAPTTTAWLLGGNTGVTTTGTNFLGPTNAGAPLIFKTKADAASSLSEKMRLTPVGRLGLGVTNPTARFDTTSSGTAIQGKSTSSNSSGRGVSGSSVNGYGVEGLSNKYIGVFGQGPSAGVWGDSGLYGVVGQANTYGGRFSGGSIGSYNEGEGYGVYGTGGTTGVGVYGQGTTGVSGYCSNTSGNAISGSGGVYGVYGANASTAGVRGDSNYVGVWGQGYNYGVYGVATATAGTSFGVYGHSPNGYAVYAAGDAIVTGTLSKSAGSFKIDHPLDPDNKWLSHSFVESPDMMNVYNGNVTTDAGGTATVDLPSYFGALNRDFRYQLTVIGDFAQAVVSKEVENNSFAIRTDKPKVKVSWQVTGIRQDAYAAEHPIVVETPKSKDDAGTRLFVPKGSGAKAAQTAPPAPSAVTLTGPPAAAAKLLSPAAN